jgi:hypothetical protein
MKKKFWVYEHPYIYIVLEHANGTVPAKIHGDVYTTKQSAEGLKAKLIKKRIAYESNLFILKKHISGKAPEIFDITDRGFWTELSIHA